MRKQILSLTLMTLLLSLILFSCYGPSENEPIDTGKGILSGKVFDANGDGISGVLVECGGKTVLTNPLGEFTLTDLPSGSRKLVNFTKDFFISNQKIVKIQDLKESYIEAALFQPIKYLTFNTSSNATISAGGVSVEIQANGLVDSKGNLYSGDVAIKLTYYNPTASKFVDAFPGEFMGVGTDGKEVPIESYGFIDVEVYNSTEKLQLAEGKPATITMPIPAKFLANAPSSIPLWFYDTQKGKWIEYGVANKVGNSYVGQVSHFSKINCDMKYDELSQIVGRVVDMDGNPLSNAWVKISGVNFGGGGQGHAENDGTFEFIRVKANAQISIVAYYAGFYSTPIEFTSEANGMTKDVGDIQVPIDPNMVSGWSEIGDLSGKYVNDIQFVNENTGWLLADGVYRTDDGGVSWTKQLDFSGQDSMTIKSIHMIDQNNGWIAGSKVLYTKDGGLNWTEVDVTGGKKIFFQKIFFVNENYGWVISSESYRTTDGGSTWIKMDISGGQTNYYLTSLFFADINTGYILSYGKLVKTTDGGASWFDLPLDSNKYGGASMYFINGQTGWIVIGSERENGKILFTNDGGNSFIEQNHSAMGVLQDLIFINAQEGWIVGYAGTIIRTTDGGNTWTNQFVKSNGDFKKVCFVTNKIGWAIGYNGNKSVLLYTDSGGEPK
ncbi:MAG: YCF48-related protein [bacterium]